MCESRKILIVTIPEKGHINPMVGVAQHLVAAGHRVEFFAQADFSEQLRRARLPCTCRTPSRVAGAPQAPPTKGREFAEKVRDRDWLRRWIEHLLLDLVPGQMAPLREEVWRSKPDLIVTDPMVYSAILVAVSERIPWASISSSLNPVTPDDWDCELTRTVRTLSRKRRHLFAEHGAEYRFKVCDAISPWLNVVFTTEEYVPRSLSDNDFSFYVGPSRCVQVRGDEVPFPWERLTGDRPLVYMSLGSQLYHHPRLFEAVARAIRPREAQLVFALGELAGTDFPATLPEHVLPVRYTPQTALLERADLLITHGGANSVMECLDHGVPLAQLPICNDQHLQAGFILRSGVGVILDPEQPSPESYREALLPLLEPDSTWGEAARRVGASYARHDGAAEAAGLIGRLATTQTPLRPAMAVQ